MIEFQLGKGKPPRVNYDKKKRLTNLQFCGKGDKFRDKLLHWVESAKRGSTLEVLVEESLSAAKRDRVTITILFVFTFNSVSSKF